MEILLYPRLSTCSKRAFLRTRARNGDEYYYFPRISLVNRLRKEFGMSQAQVIDQLLKERDYLIDLNTP